MTLTNAPSMRFVIGASSVGTLIEWYDFYIFGMLATIISKQFFPQDSGTSALLSTLAIFAAGFIIRPFGAIVFGRLGDKVGRKYTFLLTLVLMGVSTFAIGLVPGFKTIGWWAPVLVLLLRLVQGLALGGEYGGAATYVAEHAPANRRGYWTSWIQTTATLGLFLALGIILLVRNSLSESDFSREWGGWRYPFWISILLVIVSIIIRMRMSESPMFAKARDENKLSVNPLKESFGRKKNFKLVLLALFGAVMGQGVIWYTGQFYAQSFIENVCKIDFVQSRNIILVAICFATPFFIVFGSLSDRYGRKWIILMGMLLGILLYRPIYRQFLIISGGSVIQQPANLKGKGILTESGNKIIFTQTINVLHTNGIVETQKVSDTFFNAGPLSDLTANSKSSVDTVLLPGVTQSLLKDAVKSKKPGIVITRKLDPVSFWIFVLLVFIQVLFVTMVYGPMAAFLVELFPTRIRYTSMSLPYHIGNGVFGGLVPFLATLIVEYTRTPAHPSGQPLAGLWYPIAVATLCLIIGAIYLPAKANNNNIDS